MFNANDIILLLEQNPHLIFFLLFFLVMVLEDVATFIAALLVVKSMSNEVFVLSALLSGVLTLMLLLYGLGVVAHKKKWARTYMKKKGMYKVLRWLDRHLILALLACRSVPGIRFAVYGALGFCQIHFPKAFLMNLLVAVPWMVGYFWLILEFGTRFFGHMKIEYWLVVIVFLVMGFVVHKAIEKRVSAATAEGRRKKQ